ncbi:hypothetical protein C8Q76DRAFT_796176 [Earliella scabrosa]|nr:hypothetical protein C8Q76DRAFT_796176 [Earliella scabrosa]
MTVTLRPFFSEPRTFLRHLTEHKAVVGGIAALSFLLRDPSVRCDVLQVFVGSFWYHNFVSALTNCPVNGQDVLNIRVRVAPRQYAMDRDIVGVTTFYLRNGRRIFVYRSGIISPCSTISRSPSTALMNFFTEYSFGCAYPSLTFRRRALLCDLRTTHLAPTDYIILACLLKVGFQFAGSPAVWPEFHEGLATVHVDNPCFRHRFICPQQGRFFGDAGSLVDFVDPLGCKLPDPNVLSTPPFGPMIIWRLSSSYICQHGCNVNDPLVHAWAISGPLLIIPDPFPEDNTAAVVPRGRTLARGMGTTGPRERHRAIST